MTGGGPDDGGTAGTGAAGHPGAGVVVDARGLACPLPVIRLAAVARGLGPGTRVTVLWTDPAAAHDIPAWARMRGHRVEADEPGEAAPPGPGRTSVLLGTQDGPAPAGAGPS
ncbi:SirA-like domain-containing protein [Actinotalea ferrariae CF5-4]|uniref:SirA-like domain-containing protein n=1 Tax=Actinotalea ferrariae CF5-4 TaxID=948458 RepID=A0A021VUA6_9CELL|nr:sulfurtransferase TusA family protein [Actinotalea ferrariae]EYR64736.1 SirA-like domain-containing protein [Actinotalea ferrariae CF5-4]